MNRIVSLLPSATEIIVALAAENRLVGRSHECDYPASVRSLPACTASRLDTDASSQEIDRVVKLVVKDALAIYEVKEDVICRLAPDVIVTQDQCDVCAVSLAEVEAVVAALTGTATSIVTLHPNNLTAALRDIHNVGKAIGATDLAGSLIRSIEERRNAIAIKAISLEHPTVACIEWTDPLMAAGNWVPELVTFAGGRDVFGTPGKHAPWITMEKIEQVDPEVIIFMPCGFGLERCRTEAGLVAKRPGWKKLRAVQAGRVFVTDGNSYFNRPGPRLAESLEILVEILHPNVFSFGHDVANGGDGWMPLLA